MDWFDRCILIHIYSAEGALAQPFLFWLLHVFSEHLFAMSSCLWMSYSCSRKQWQLLQELHTAPCKLFTWKRRNFLTLIWLQWSFQPCLVKLAYCSFCKHKLIIPSKMNRILLFLDTLGCSGMFLLVLPIVKAKGFDCVGEEEKVIYLNCFLFLYRSVWSNVKHCHMKNRAAISLAKNVTKELWVHIFHTKWINLLWCTAYLEANQNLNGHPCEI